MKQAVSKKKTKHYPLTPIRATWMNELLANRHLLFDAVNQFSSPINIHHAGPFQDNYQEFHQFFQKHNLKHEIFFARKANKSRLFVREAKRLGFGVDTASFRELQESLKMGCSPDKLVVTAAIKTPELIQLALQKEVLLILDNEDEARAVNAIAESLGKTPKIGIRISGFKHKGLKLYSRFGFDIEQALNFIVQNIGPQKTFSQLRFAGLHFHLNGYSTDERGTALLATIKLSDALKEASYRTEFIDIGGGILINYLKSEEEWKNFRQALGEAVQGNIDPITFRNNGLGMELIDGQLYGQPSVYPYFNKTPRIPFLEAVLASKNEDNLTASQLLRDRGIEIRIEPGRSLLDQTGMTVARVVYRKYDAQGQLLVGLQMNRTQMFSSSADFLLDPVMLYQANHQNPKGSIPVYFVGAYCLEQDVILKRQIHLPAVPEIGDLVCFFNTAGYMMHFYETEAHLFDLATNLVAHKKEDLSVPYLFNKDQ